MGISSYLSKFALGITPEGLLSPTYVGTGTTTGAGAGGNSPTITSIVYTGDDTATSTAGGNVTVNGTNFNTGVTVLVADVQATQVTRVSATQLTFVAPANAAGNYILYVVNTDGGAAISVPGLQYSGVPTWTTGSGSLGTPTTSVSFTTTIAATGDAPISYAVVSGALPAGITLNTASGVISGTTPSVSNSTTYNFTVRATDAQNQDTNRAFSLTVNPVTTVAVDLLVVAGGGGGHRQGGGGGGGGYVEASSFNMTMGQAYAVVVGNGGSASSDSLYGSTGGQGSSSSIGGSYTAIGGGGGGNGNGGSGGSGGGGHGAYSVSGSGGYGSQGFNGGIGPSYGGNFNNFSASGGGGGAGGQGANGNAGGPNPPSQSGGNGGPGKTWLNGSTYAPGGGGSGDPYYSASSGSQGTGYGYGAGGTAFSDGGTGIVIIRYADTLPAAASVSGATTSTSGGYRYYQFTSNGSITF